MSDARLRQAEREYYSNLDNDSFCRYVQELKRSRGVVSVSPRQGHVQGEFPAILHLLAPDLLLFWPETMKPSFENFSGEPWSREFQSALEQSRQQAQQCLPRRGILAEVLGVFGNRLMDLGNQLLHCTCGGEERGHSPDCMMVMGGGHVVEDYYEQIQTWTSRHSQFNLLEEYLKYGTESLVDSFDDDNSIYDIFDHLNAAFGSDFHAAMRDPPYFKLSLADHYANNVVTIVINEDRTCSMGWSVGDPGDNHYLSNEFARAIMNIPALLEQYPVWF